jgi:hypothetical protein
VNGKDFINTAGGAHRPGRVKVIPAQGLIFVIAEKIVMNRLFAIVAMVSVAALTANPVLAAVRHRAEGPTSIERPNRSDLYQSDAQGNQPYPNPDRELYVNRSCC